MVSSLQINVKIFLLIRSCVEVYVKKIIFFDFMSLVDCNDIPNSPLTALITVFSPSIYNVAQCIVFFLLLNMYCL